MLKSIKEFGSHVEIAGFRQVKIDDPNELLRSVNEEKSAGLEIQLFDSSIVATWQHLYFAVLNALTSFRNGMNVSKTLAMETLLYAAADRQISKATAKIGIKRDTSEVAVLIIGENADEIKSAFSRIKKKIKGRHDDAVLELTKSKSEKIKKTFNIGRVELASISTRDQPDDRLVDLVIERVALVSTEK